MPVIPNLEIQEADGSYAIVAEGQYRYSIVLEAEVAKQVVVPLRDDNSLPPNYAFFAAEAPFYADYTHMTAGGDVAAVIPSDDIVDGTGPDFNPTVRTIRNVEKISLISRTDQVVTITFYI